MYNSKYYTCEQIDQRLLEGYYDDAVAAGYTGSKSQYLAGLLQAINYSANPTITADKVAYNSASGLYKNVQEAIDGIVKKTSKIKGTITQSDDLDSKKENSDIGLWFVNRKPDPGIVLVCYDFENHYVQVKLSATRNVSINETTNKPSIQYRKYIDNAWTEWTEIEFNILKTHILQADGIAIQGTPLDNYIQHFKKTSTFAGIATPTTNPGTPDGSVFYIANQEGTYTNFNGIKLSLGESSILKYSNGAWEKILFPALDAYEDSDSAKMEDALIYVLTHNGNAIKPMTDFESVFDSEGNTLNDKIYGSKGEYIEVDIMDEVLSNYLNAYLEKNGVVTSYNGWKVTQPILLKKDEYILIDTKAVGYPQIAKASENPIKVGDTLIPLSLVGDKYLATEDVWVVFSGKWSNGCYVKKGFQERIEGIKDRVESLEGKVPLLEELRTDMYSTTIIKNISNTLYDNAILGYIQDGIIKSDTSWKVSQPFYVKKGTHIKIIGKNNCTATLAKVSKSTISVGDSVETLITGRYVEFIFSEDMLVVVAFERGQSEVIINYTEGNDVKGKSEQGASAYDALVGQSSLLREVPYQYKYFRINAYIDPNGAIVEYNNYFISKPIELKKGETIIAIISGIGISGLSLYVGPDTYQPLIPLMGVNQKCVYTAEEDCRVAISAQSYNDVTIKIKKFVVTGDILSRIEKLEETDLKINKVFSDSWKDNMLIQYSKLLEVMENKPTSVIPIFVSSDTHGNGVEQHRIIHNLDKDGIEINNIFLGDNTPYSSVPIKDYNLKMRERVKDCKNFIAVVGNHDFVHSEKSENNYYNLNYCYLSTLRIRKCKSKDGSYVAYDDRRGVKFVVINNIAFTTEFKPVYKFGDMVDWLIDELSANDGYDVVILKHWMDNRVFESRTGAHTLSPADNYAAFFDARKNKTSGTFNDSTGGVHVYDFSNCKQDLLCVLHGHEHIELKYSEVGHVTTYCGHNFNSGNYDCMFGAIDREDNVLRVYRWNTIEAFDEWVIPLN